MATIIFRILGSVGEPINPEAWLWYYKIIGNSKCSIVDTFWQTETGGHVITPLPGATPMKPGSAVSIVQSNTNMKSTIASDLILHNAYIADIPIFRRETKLARWEWSWGAWSRWGLSGILATMAWYNANHIQQSRTFRRDLFLEISRILLYRRWFVFV